MCKAIDDSFAVVMRTIGGKSLVISTVGAKALDEDKVAYRQAFSASEGSARLNTRCSSAFPS
jgi:hypothetical protein